MMRLSRSVFQPKTVPLYYDFEDAGMVGAMSRLLARSQQLVGPLALPEWLWSLDFSHAVVACAACNKDVSGIIASVANATRVLREQSADALQSSHPCAQTAVQMAATARLHFGEMMEAVAASAASALAPKEKVAPADVDHSTLALLYHDSHCAAVWTSAHAEFLGTIQDLLGNRPATEELVRDFMLPPPDLYSVANSSNLAHVGPLSERVASPRCCSTASQSLLAIISRVTNAGSRGWETTLLAAAKESEGAVRVCMQSMAVAFSGMNPVVHPATRRPWRERFVILRAMRVQTTQDFKELVRTAPGALKEAVRMHLAAVYVLDCATLDAMRHMRHPIGQLEIPPLAVPHPSLSAAMRCMAEAGAHMVASRESVAVSIKRHLVSEPRSRKKSDMRLTSRYGKREPHALSYSSSWLGGRSGPLGVALRSSVQVVSGLMSASYRSIYIPFWLHGNHHNHRASRLDSAQHAALHTTSAAHRMLAQLSTEDYQLAERLAIGTPNASILTIGEACNLLGVEPSAHEPRGQPCSASSRVVQEAEVDVMSLRARDAALLFAFVRISCLRATMLSYNLGESTRRMQALAVCKRMMLPLAPEEDPCEAVQKRLPEHATVLHFCSECRRVVNCVQDNTGKDQAFNEIGLAASMLDIDGDVCTGNMRCAKRSSAALRTAVALAAAAENLKLEGMDPVPNPLLPMDLKPATVVATMCNHSKRKDATAPGPSSNRAPATCTPRESSSEVAKFRRDLKSCFEQNGATTSCGEWPLVRVPILGRVIRVFGNWYALCAMCGALARVSPTSRFRGEICCLRCDFEMLAGKKAAAEMRNALPRPPPPACRFCGKVEPENGVGMKWKCIAAPADTGGRNAGVPAPLRVCWYCPSHYRAWLVSAHKTMSTASIFSHLLSRARPIFGANTDTHLGPGMSTTKNLGDDGDNDDGDGGGKHKGAPPKRQSASAKRKSALTRVIAKNNRKRRIGS